MGIEGQWVQRDSGFKGIERQWNNGFRVTEGQWVPKNSGYSGTVCPE